MASTLEQVSNDLAAAVERAGASLVRVDARRRFPASGIVWSSDGVIVTAHHVVKREEGITIVVITHNPALACQCGRSVKIIDGMIYSA